MSVVFTLYVLSLPGAALAEKSDLNHELEDIVIFSEADVAPWQLYLGSADNWTVWVTGEETRSQGEDLVIVRRLDKDPAKTIINASWTSGSGQVYWQSEQRIDVSEYEKRSGALSIITRIDRKPEGEVTFKMGCGYPCEGSYNAGTLFQRVPEDRWFRASFELECFKDSGAWLDRIMTPLIITAESEFEISISDVRITAKPEPASLVKCD